MKGLKYARVKKDLNQKDLADIIGATNSQISNWESGKVTPSIDVLKKLSEVLDVTIDYLVKGE